MCTSCSNNACGGCGSINVPQGLPGQNGQGWSPRLAVVSDGPTREVLQLIGWTGGTGAAPGGVGQYIGSSGLVTTAGAAANIRGSNGAAATNPLRFYTIPVHNGQSADFCIIPGGNAYRSFARMIFPGTTYGTPIAVLFNVWKRSGDGRVDVELWDAENTVQLCERANINSTSATNIENVDTTGVTWPTTPIVMHVRALADSGTEGGIGSVTLIF